MMTPSPSPCRFLQTDPHHAPSCFSSSFVSSISVVRPFPSAAPSSCVALPPSRPCRILEKQPLLYLKPWQKDKSAVASDIGSCYGAGKISFKIAAFPSFLAFMLQLSPSYPTCELSSSLHLKAWQMDRNRLGVTSNVCRSNIAGRMKLKSEYFEGSLFERLQDGCTQFSQHGRQGRIFVARSILQWSGRPHLVGEIPRVAVITSGKGGVGKTTTTANLGLCLARLEFKVIAIDADVGLRNLDLLLGLENRVNYTAVEVLNGECRLDQALIRDKRWKNFELLCINKPRYKMPIGFGGKALTWLVDALMKRSGGSPDFILIDCPAGIDAGFITAITPANEAILVTTPDITSLRDADRVTGLLECDGIKDIKMIVNRVRSDMIKGEDMMSVLDVQEMLGLPLLGVVPEDAEVIRSTNRGYPLVLNRPPTLAGLAFEQAAWRLVEQDSMKEVPVEEAPVRKSFFPFF